MRNLIFSLTALSLMGCSTPQQRAPENSQDLALLRNCLAAKGPGSMYNGCVTGRIANSSPTVINKAYTHWTMTLEQQGPDAMLFGAVLEKNIEGAKKALSIGANVNRQFTYAELYGPHAPAEEKLTALYKAGETNLAMFELLMKAGGDASWIPPSKKENVVVENFTRTTSKSSSEQGPTLLGVQLAEIALQNGYRPNATDLAYFKRTADSERDADIKAGYQAFLRKALASASATDRANMAEVEAKKIKDRNHEKATEAAEREKTLRIAEQTELIARHQLDQQMFTVGQIGTHVCLDAPAVTGGVTYAGFVVGASETRIQVRIDRAFYRSAPDQSPAGFQPQILWDSPLNWRRCY